MNNFQQITKSLHNQTKGVAKRKMEEKGRAMVVNTIKEAIDITVYDAYNPKQYNRTYQLRESVGFLHSFENADSVTFRFGHIDGFGESYSPTENPLLGRAYTLWDWSGGDEGDDISRELPYIVHEGLSGKNITGNIFWDKPKPYMEVARRIIENEVIDKIFK